MRLCRTALTLPLQSPFAPSLGARPLFHFSGPHFSPDASAADSDASFSGALAMCNHGVHASFQHLKSMFLDFYRGEESPPGSGPGAVPGASGNQVSLRDGLQHIVCVTEGPEPAAQAPVSDNKELAELYAAGAAQTREGSSSIDNSAAGRTVYFRVYAPRPSGRSAGGAPTMELVEVGPSFDFVLRRRQPADSARLAASLKRPKTAAEKNTQGKTKRKNVETDDMGDMIGRVHMEKQDLGKLQTRKMKGLKPGRDPAAAGGDEEMEGDDDDDSEPGFLEDSDEELIFEGSEGDEGLDADDDDEHLDDEMADMLETAGEVEAPKKKARK
jgi:ribosome production factor 2